MDGVLAASQNITHDFKTGSIVRSVSLATNEVLAQLPDNYPLTPFRGMFANGLGVIAAYNHTDTDMAADHVRI